MINRVLIRTKVVQILYSHLLVQKRFSIESMPGAPTKEKRFAYSLYLDMLVLMERIAASISRRGGGRPLEETRFIRSIKADDQIRSLLVKYGSEGFPFAGIIDDVSDKIKESGLYKNFLKDSADETGVAGFVWNDIFRIIIMNDPLVRVKIQERENYSLKGVDRMVALMNATFSNFMESHDSGAGVEQELKKSLDKARELYFRLLALPLELTEMQERRIDDNRNKFLVSDADLNPDMRFVENSLVSEIRRSDEVLNYLERNKISWLREDPRMMESLLNSILESSIYKDYMALPATDNSTDAEFWRNIFRKVILNNASFLETLEEESVFWNDDLEIISTFVLKTFRKLSEGEGNKAILDQYKDEEDASFGKDLLRAVMRNKELYRSYIDEALDRRIWESDRLAFMDVVIIETALAEILNFPKIPLSVSLNEYIEIAKSYSTSKSGAFVNGILGAIISRLREKGILHK